MRTGLAKCINYDEFNKLRNAGVTPVANGPYPPGVDGYLADTGYPKFDEAGGKALIDAYKAEKGITGDLEIAFGTTADPFNRGTNELIASTGRSAASTPSSTRPSRASTSPVRSSATSRSSAGATSAALNPDRNFVWWLSAVRHRPARAWP